MANKKEGGKNRKIGRHSRNPSSANQAKRTERNKAKRAQKIVHQCPVVSATQHMLSSPRDMRYGWGTLEFRGVRTRVYHA